MELKSKLQTFLIKTYGCQMNHSDSERITTVLEDAGLQKTNIENKADIIIYNTCSVRQSAEDRILGLGKNIRKIKKERDEKYDSYRLPITVLTGCMARRCHTSEIRNLKSENQKYLESLRRRAPWYDIIIEIKDIAKLPKLLKLSSSKSDRISSSVYSWNKSNTRSEKVDYLSLEPTPTSSFKISIPISTGCNNFCSYCIVPFARGKLKNRPLEEILNETRKFIKKGYKDLFLLGQSVNCWEYDEYNFLDLLKKVDKLEGNFWLSFLSTHPKFFSDELVEYFIKSANKGTKLLKSNKVLESGSHIRPYLNIAMQSGSNKILKKMNRKYTIEEFEKTCNYLKENIPNLNLSTDIIVGFPDETQNDFEKTVTAMKRIKFDMAYVNKFSPRKYTQAAELDDDISWKEKKRREVLLNDILEKSALENNKNYLDQSLPVLIEKKKEGKYFGKTWNFKDIRIEFSQKDLEIGKFYEAKITDITPWALEGQVIK